MNYIVQQCQALVHWSGYTYKQYTPRVIANTYNTRVCSGHSSRAYYKGEQGCIQRGKASVYTTEGYFDNDQRSQTSVARRRITHNRRSVKNNHTLLIQAISIRLIHSTIVKYTHIAGNPPSLPSWSQTKGLGLVRRIYTKAVNRCVLSRAHKLIHAMPPSCRQGGLADNK